MGRAPCCENRDGLRKGAWTAEEDEKLVSFVRRNNGHGNWKTLPELAGLQRCGKSCRLRWTNYLRPNIKHGNFTAEEEWTITQLHAVLGNKWSAIASRLPGRTDNEIKNHWNTRLKKQLCRMGFDPVTHRPVIAPGPVSLNKINVKDDSCMMKHDGSRQDFSFNCRHKTHTKTLPRVTLPDKSYVSHMAQWELARLEAEARQHADASRTGVRQGSTESRGHGKAHELLESIVGELLEAPIAGTGTLPSLHTTTSCSSAGSQLHSNEADITSDLTPLLNILMSATPSSSSPFRHDDDPLLPLIPASPLPAPVDAPSQINYWATMLSLVGPVISSCPA